MIKQDQYGHYPFKNEPYLYEDLEFLCSGKIIPEIQGMFDEPPQEAYIEDLTIELETPFEWLLKKRLDVTFYVPTWLFNQIETALLEDLAYEID
jgi:hypothetical protein